MTTIPEMLKKLNELYNKEELLIREANKIKVMYEQIQEDKETLQNLIMHQSNKQHRFNKLKNG